MPKEERRLPFGGTTTSGMLYCETWVDLADYVVEFMKKFGNGVEWKLSAFDPELRFVCNNVFYEVSVEEAAAMRQAICYLNHHVHSSHG